MSWIACYSEGANVTFDRIIVQSTAQKVDFTTRSGRAYKGFFIEEDSDINSVTSRADSSSNSSDGVPPLLTDSEVKSVTEQLDHFKVASSESWGDSPIPSWNCIDQAIDDWNWKVVEDPRPTPHFANGLGNRRKPDVFTFWNNRLTSLQVGNDYIPIENGYQSDIEEDQLDDDKSDLDKVKSPEPTPIKFVRFELPTSPDPKPIELRHQIFGSFDNFRASAKDDWPGHAKDYYNLSVTGSQLFEYCYWLRNEILKVKVEAGAELFREGNKHYQGTLFYLAFLEHSETLVHHFLSAKDEVATRQAILNHTWVSSPKNLEIQESAIKQGIIGNEESLRIVSDIIEESVKRNKISL